MPDLRLLPLDHDHLPHMERWLAAPHVARWWNEPHDRASVEAKYVPRIEGVEPVRMFAISLGAPIGFLQTYSWADAAEHAERIGAHPTEVGVDLAIGDPARIGRGLGPRVLSLFLAEHVFADPAVTGCVADPDVQNARSVRAFERAGFVHEDTRTVPGPDGPYEVAVVRAVRRERGLST